ncbi:MAG: hypothetical protein FWD72_01325 [Eggerthellaceae bacterium]|nr:hypothetical protein [Eggerthellaceae bacterium]
MYHELTEKAERRRTLRWVFAVLVVLVVIVGGWFAFDQMNKGMRSQGELSVRNAILNSAKQCCAIEGSYPSSLQYLEKNYGLSINHDQYIVTYEAFAENVMPSVVVIAK